MICSGERGSSMQAARRSATRRRYSTSRNTRMPPSDDNRPPSNLTTMVLPETGDRPGSGSIRLFMAGVVSRKWRGLALAPISYAKSAVCAISANLRCIMGATCQTPPPGHLIGIPYMTRVWAVSLNLACLGQARYGQKYPFPTCAKLPRPRRTRSAAALAPLGNPFPVCR